MKSYNTIYYLLFVLLIIGAFTSMVQNSYVLNLFGAVACSFGILFLYQLFKSLKQTERKDYSLQAELLALFVLSVLFALRLFHIYIPLSEILFAITGMVLIFVYLKKMLQRYGLLHTNNLKLARIAAPFLHQLYAYFGMTAFVLLAVFLIKGLFVPHHLLKGSEVSGFKLVAGLKDRSMILLSLFFNISLNMGLTRIDVLPSMYSDEYLQAYFKLVNNAETFNKKPVNGSILNRSLKRGKKGF